MAAYFCYNCGHLRDNHRKVIIIETRNNEYLDCLQPIKRKKTGILNMEWFGICQCTEYQSKEKREELVNK